jgi:hypothetical protein
MGKTYIHVLYKENRFTRSQLEKNPEFNNQCALRDFDKSILNFCGTNRDAIIDKIKELGLRSTAFCHFCSAIKQLPLTLECKVIYKQKQDENAVTEEIKKYSTRRMLTASAAARIWIINRLLRQL